MLTLLFFAGCVSVPNPPPRNPQAFSEKSTELQLKEYINAHLGNASNIAFATDGTLYFTDHGDEGRVKKIRLDLYSDSKDFMELSEWVSPFNQNSPKAEGLRVDNQGRLLIAESGTGKLLRITQDARKLEVLADSYDGYRFTTVKDLAIGQGDDLFVSSPFSGTIYRIRPKEGFIGILNDDLVRVEGLSISPDGTRLVAAEPDASRVVVFDIPESLIPVKSWTLVDFSPTGVEPKGLAFDSSGFLYVGLGSNREVRVFDLNLGKQIETFDSGDEANVLRYFEKYLYVAGGKGVRRFPVKEL
jgi:sugar lactone lactonase YvrE